jgi:biopolymer transport protein ExbD
MFIALFATALAAPVRAMEDAPAGGEVPPSPAGAKYQRDGTSFYGKGDVARAHPSAVILAPGGFTQSGDAYFFKPKTKAPKSLYIETVTDWVEPITPPDMPASLGVPPDAMQVREPQGDVEVALPSAPANFVPVTPNMTLPNGAVLKTGADGTAAVLFGGVDSARLMPNSAAAVQQTVAPQSRSAEVDLTTGGVFSKVGTQVGVKGEFEVHTPGGNAVAQGGDFVTIVANGRTDVWTANGSVQLNAPDGKKGPVSVANGVGPLKVMRLPAIADPHASFLADTETLSQILNFIPLANQKIKALRAKKDSGAALTANEEAYLARLKQVPCVMKLALVTPAAAPKPLVETKPAPKPKPLVSTPTLAPLPAPEPEPAPAPTPTPAPLVIANPPPAPAVASTAAAPSAPVAPGAAKSLKFVIRADGKINFQKVTLTPEEFKSKINAIVQSTPDQAIVIKAGKSVPYEKFETVMNICHAAQVKNLSVAGTPPTPAESETENLPGPGLLMHPVMAPMTGADSTPPPPSTPTTNAPAPAAP